MVGVKAGGGDDAIHYRRHWWSRKTLCGLTARTRNVLGIHEPTPDVHATCWTCMPIAAKENL